MRNHSYQNTTPVRWGSAMEMLFLGGRSASNVYATVSERVPNVQRKTSTHTSLPIDFVGPYVKPLDRRIVSFGPLLIGFWPFSSTQWTELFLKPRLKPEGSGYTGDPAKGVSPKSTLSILGTLWGKARSASPSTEGPPRRASGASATPGAKAVPSRDTAGPRLVPPRCRRRSVRCMKAA